MNAEAEDCKIMIITKIIHVPMRSSGEVRKEVRQGARKNGIEWVSHAVGVSHTRLRNVSTYQPSINLFLEGLNFCALLVYTYNIDEKSVPKYSCPLRY